MNVTSSDGTAIAYDRAGSGPALILVDGALCYRAFGPSAAMAKRLAPHFTVYTYDRRGRGESGDTEPYDIEREIEDIEALVKEAGGTAYLCGFSSGAVIALEAAARLPSITKAVLYEAPFIVDDAHAPWPGDIPQRFRDLIEAGRRGAAVKQFMHTVDAPAFIVALMPLMVPVWSKLKGVAHTLPYDLSFVATHESGKPFPADQWAAATQPVLVLAGGKSPEWMRNAQRDLADVLPEGRLRTLPGQTHMVKADVVAPVVVEFFTG